MRTPRKHDPHKDSGTCFAPHPTETYVEPYNIAEVPVYCTSPIDAGQHRYTTHVGLGSKMTRIGWM